MRAFAVSMCIFTLSGINRGLITLIHGSPTNYMQRDSVQTSTLIGGVVSICLTGLFFLLLYHDTTVRRVTAESEFDVLSGTLNRRGIERRLIVELNHIKRNAQKLSIGLIDVDHFKSVNDTVGHPAGDTVLRAVVSAITGQIRDYDFLGRFGGDEFLLLLPQSSATDALVVANRIGEAVRACPSPIDGTPLTISIGISEAVPGEASEILIARADHALYNAKSAGRNCSRSIVFDSTQESLPDSESLPDLLPS
jgi:diguanylate cyclase (GGDEF)-like protein